MKEDLPFWGPIKKKFPLSCHLAARTTMIDTVHATLKKRAEKLKIGMITRNGRPYQPRCES